jgi:two-component system, response regulator YesN
MLRCVEMNDRKRRSADQADSPFLQETFAYYQSLAKIQTHVDGHIDQHLSLRAAAAIVGLEPKYFSTFFRNKTGLSFRRWLTMLRIGRAQYLLRQRNHSINDVAHAVGFRNLRTFERAFKENAGSTPRDFKKGVRPS